MILVISLNRQITTMKDSNYLEINRNSWNNRTEHHYNSDFYDVDGFIKGKSSLNEIELNLLGDITNKSILHLQCHFGQDTISLARMGAKVTGVDLSDKAIAKADKLAEITQTDATFICCDIYDLPNHLTEKFDMVFTSYGTVGWLPDLDKWANIISMFLKPNGQFFFIDFHPVVWMFDNDFKEIKYNYFNTGAIQETSDGTYAEKKAEISNKTITWNHAMSEVVNTLIKKGLEINSLNEFDYSPYDCFNNTIEFDTKKFRIKGLDNKIPIVYAIVATKTRAINS